MTRQAVVIDTNVVVAGLITSDAGSPVSRILDGMLAAAFPFVLSEALIAEYRAVPRRPKLRKLHGLNDDELDEILVDLVQHAIVLDPAAATARAPDPGDQLLWDLLEARDDILLVTGEQRLLRDAGMRGRVVSPREFTQSGG
ncbi:MAG: putative toxin-antitoxin system toxin component, PIN family [Burkholderiaceae bacterium]|nr:putative toxin-antitoxin system toxin component, PIN family [Burkholderiaceae bacterium]